MKHDLAFYARPALPVARSLLGQILVHDTGERQLRARIVETEAYLGGHDLAAHSSGGITPRTEVMFGPAGVAYVYLIYGMHHCLNVVVSRPGVAAAVLIRGVELDGTDPGVRGDGPGKLCKALGITLRHNRTSLLEAGPLWIESGPTPRPSQVKRGPRIGVDYAGEWAKKPYRFWIQGSPGVSRVSGYGR